MKIFIDFDKKLPFFMYFETFLVWSRDQIELSCAGPLLKNQTPMRKILMKTLTYSKTVRKNFRKTNIGGP